MKNIVLTLLLTPFLLIGQPQFTVTDLNGNIWDSNEILEEGTTIIVQFYSPSMTCWPSSNSIELLTEAYDKYAGCNKLFFIQVAEWGTEYSVVNFLEVFGNTEIPTIIGYDQGQELAIEWIDFGLQWAYELWLLRPDGSYEFDIPYAWDLDQQVLVDALENEGFSECEYTIGLEDYELENKDEAIYDLQGRILKEIPKSGFYIKGGKKHCIIK